MLAALNPKLDADAVRRALADEGVAVVRNFLAPALARQILEALETATPWDLAHSADGQGRLIKADQLAQMTAAEVQQAIAPALASPNLGGSGSGAAGRGGAGPAFQFVYDTFIVIDPNLVELYPQVFLYRLAHAINQPGFLEQMRRLTGSADSRRLSVMAARYRAGHFLTLHDDIHETERREVAYVLNLTKDWRPEWGGLLHIVGEDRKTVLKTVTPEFNTMVLMRPPTWHFVSQVASYAPAPRYTVTGWMLSS
jgi:Rps23 Pro-64 3,4-dihydroxylase Tpa1-like proline 4-hydroxylase